MQDVVIAPPRPSRKRLALFFDGTWNAVATNTNVWRMKALCADDSSDGARQLTYYDVGVNGLLGGVWGKGLSRNIIEAYEWLVDHYDDDDEIFIFGFSRGAYAARSLAGFIAKCGMLRGGGVLGIDQLYTRYRRPDDMTIWALIDPTTKMPPGPPSRETVLMRRYARAVRIKMVGVWDTVGALGIPLFHIPHISRSTLRFLHTGLRVPVENGYHAVAVDELRRKFAPTLWTAMRRTIPLDTDPLPRSLESVEQRWFVGAHANVGGGCHDDLLAQIPLRWMMSKAARLGLTFRGPIELDGNEQNDGIARSYKEFARGLYAKVSAPYHRPIGEAPTTLGDGTNGPVNETIDGTVFERWRDDPDYKPLNLLHWAHGHGIDPVGIKGSVRADNPAIPVPD